MAGKDVTEIRAQIEAAVAGMGLDDLRRLADQMLSLGATSWDAPQPDQPERRRPRREEPATYRVRVDLEHARPPIWRRLDLRSDIRLDTLHQVLQAAFGWWDCHLHRFAIGPSVFDRDSQLFLCPFDVEEGEPGIPASDVRLDETLAQPGDVLRYTYDFGDSWDLTIKLEKVLPVATEGPAATCVDGRRAAPPEDCGGFRDADDLATVIDDPTRFDVEEVNRALQERDAEPAVDPRLIALLDPLRGSPIGDRLLQATASTFEQTPDEPSRSDKAAALHAHIWFLTRAAESRIELTSAGYLKPADVRAASRVVPGMAGWIGANNREVNTVPVLRFRESLQALGLLRKHKGTLVLTRAGAADRADPDLLWSHVAKHLPIGRPGTIEEDAGLLALAYAATTADGVVPMDELAHALTQLGWRREADKRPLDAGAAAWAAGPTLDVLRNVGAEPASPRRHQLLGTAARALARAALRPTT